MKLIKLLQTPHEYYCLKSYKEYLTKLYANARDGKDPNCRKCDNEGFIKTKKNIAFGKREWNIPEVCDCVKSEKTEIFKKIEHADSLIKTYNIIFGTLDDDMTLDIFSKKFGNEDMISSIKKYLELGSGLSLYFTGESGVGKTTILKMLWQIYAMNKINVFYLKANHFEGLYKNLFNINASKENIKASIDSKEEAEDLTIGAWLDLLPTVRGIDTEGSPTGVWVIFNPKRYYDFSYSLIKPYLSKLKTITFKHNNKEYKYHEYEDKDTYILNVNYYSNSFENVSLDNARKRLKRENPEMYEHVWLGKIIYSGGRVFSGQQLKYYNYNDFIENQARYYTYRAIVDPAFGRENCFTSSVIYYQVGNDFYIIDSGLMRTDANNTTDEAITNFLKSYNVQDVMCEANFHQQESVKRLRHNFAVQPFYQKVNKIERIVDNSIKIREHCYFDEQSLHSPSTSSVNEWLKTREGRNYIAMMQLFNFSDIPRENCNKDDDFSYIDFVDVITSLVMFTKKRY